MSRPGWSLAGAAVLAAVGCAWLLPAREPHGDAWLLTLRLAAEDASGPGGRDPRTWIALRSQGEAARILSEDLYSASSPSPSFDAGRFVFVGRPEAAAPSQILEMRAGGGRSRAITRGNGAPADPIYLPDGRILYSDAAPAGVGPPASRALFSCAPDGSDVERLTFGDRDDLSPRLLPDGRILFRRSSPRAAAAGGDAWMTIHPDGTGLAKHEEEISSPPPEVAGASTVLRQPAGYLVIGEVPLRPEQPPPVLTSVVRGEVRTGTLLCLNVYASRDAAIASLAPGGVDRVRVSDVSLRAPRVLGEAPVLADGSFFVEVPADTPLRLALLSRDGRTLAEQRNGIWARPNENRGCIGCHEAGDLVPDNRRPLAVGGPPVSFAASPAGAGGAGAR